MILSFGWTSEEFLAGKKTVTRRLWSERTFQSWVKAWNEGRLEHKAYNKQACFGGKQIGSIKLTACPYREPIAQMPIEDLSAEGGKYKTLDEFIDGYFKGDRTLVPTVVRFQKL